MADFTMNTTLGQLLADPNAKKVLDQYVPGMSANPMVAFVSGASLKDLVAMPQAAQMGLTAEKMQDILDEINKMV